jgi:hypothetical protein
VDERLVVASGRTYAILVAEPGRPALEHPVLGPDDLLEAGPLLLARGDPLLRPLWRGEEERLARIVTRATEGAGARAARKRLALARRVLAVLEP